MIVSNDWEKELSARFNWWKSLSPIMIVVKHRKESINFLKLEKSPTNAIIVANHLKKISAHFNWRKIILPVMVGVKNRTRKHQLPQKTGKKLNKCDDCGKRLEKELSACFNWWKSLSHIKIMVKHRTRKHQLPQTGKKPYKCDHCSKPFEKNLTSLQLGEKSFRLWWLESKIE